MTRSLGLLLAPLALLLAAAAAQAQVCPDAAYLLTTQAEVDAFPAGCTTVSGNLEISAVGAVTDITDLAPLGEITSVGGLLSVFSNPMLTSLAELSALTSVGGLSIQNNPLTSLDGLDGLTSVAGSVYIENNYVLESLDGLGGIQTIGGTLAIGGNPLPSLDGLNGLTSVGGNVQISQNALTSLAGLDALSDVGGELAIQFNPALESLSGLSALTTVGSRLTVEGNDALTSLAGLDGVASLPWLSVRDNAALTSLAGLGVVGTVGLVSVHGNAALTSLDGLDGITAVGLDLGIANNASLTSLDGLDNIASVGRQLSVVGNGALTSLDAFGGLTDVALFDVEDNASLGACAAGLAGLISGWPPAFGGVRGRITITGNAPGGACNSPEEVLAASPPPACEPGSFSDTGNAPCTLAPAGFYVAAAGALDATACEAGTYQPSEGATSCLVAGPGFYVAATAAAAQFACQLGTFSDTSGATSCTSAAVGFYVDTEAATEATACPAGQTTAADGSTSASDCFAPAESLSVSITPLGTPDVAHYGGLVFFRVRVDNDTDERLRQDLWLTLTKPSGTESVQYRARVNLRGGRSASGLFVTFVSRHADAGTYTYTASVGDVPDATGSDAFSFVKRESGQGKTEQDAVRAMNAFSNAEARTGGAVTEAVELRMDGGDPAAVWGDADGAWDAATTADATVFALATPFPNPASGRTTVAFSVETAGAVRLTVYDALGRQVAVLADGEVEAGAHRATLAASALPTGFYLVRLTTADGQTATQRLTIVL